MIFGISANGRLYIFFDMPFALQIGNGVRWWRTTHRKLFIGL